MTWFLSLQKNDADAWIILFVPELVVDGRQVKVHLSGELRFEVLDLQINQYITAQAHVIEQQVNEKVLTADFQMVLTAEECEALSEFQNEISHILDQAAFKLPLADFRSKCEETKL